MIKKYLSPKINDICYTKYYVVKQKYHYKIKGCQSESIWSHGLVHYGLR